MCPVSVLARMTLKVTVDVYGKRKWAAGGGGPGDLFNKCAVVFFLFLDS